MSNTNNTKKIELNDSMKKELEKYSTTSDKIRFLNAKGFSRRAISDLLGKRYQHIRNVLVQDAVVGKSFELKK